eukprot:scaffold77372_cov55-Phaeocystis_antarctica.AAC.1
MSDGSLKQPMQARLSATGKGAAPSSAAGGATAAALAASLSAFSAASATRTSLVAAPRSGCCARSLASSGLKPRSGSATRSPRTASRGASGVQGSHMRGAPGARAAAPLVVAATAALRLSHGLAKFEKGETRNLVAELKYALILRSALKVLLAVPWRLAGDSPDERRLLCGGRQWRLVGVLVATAHSAGSALDATRDGRPCSLQQQRVGVSARGWL